MLVHKRKILSDKVCTWWALFAICTKFNILCCTLYPFHFMITQMEVIFADCKSWHACMSGLRGTLLLSFLRGGISKIINTNRLILYWPLKYELLHLHDIEWFKALFNPLKCWQQIWYLIFLFMVPFQKLGYNW